MQFYQGGCADGAKDTVQFWEFGGGWLPPERQAGACPEPPEVGPRDPGGRRRNLFVRPRRYLLGRNRPPHLERCPLWGWI